MTRRSRTMLALEELHRAAAAGLGELECREARVVAEVGAHVLGDQVVNQRDVVVGNRGVQRRVGQAHVLDVEIRARVRERLHREKVAVLGAQWSGVSPSLFAEFLSAPASIKAVMRDVLSIMAAACNTVSPLGVRAFASAPLAMSSFAISSWPFSAAT